MSIKITDDDKDAPEDVEEKPVRRKPLTEKSLTVQATSARDLFLNKPRRVDTHNVKLNGTEIEIKIQGLDSREFNRMVADHPVRRNNDKDRNSSFNTDTFPPAFLSRAVIEPKLTEDEWTDIFASPDWTPGELGALVDLAWSAANRGFDVPFGVGGSG